MDQQKRWVETDWVRGTDVGGEHERMVAVRHGYDCRQECEHPIKGDHGWHGDELFLVARRPQQRGIDGSVLEEAAELRLYTVALRGRVGSVRLDIFSGRLARPAYVHLHASMISACAVDSAGQVRDAEECRFLRHGRCYLSHTGSSSSEALWTPSASAVVTTPLLEDLERLMQTLLSLSDVWELLLAWRDKRVVDRRQEMVTDRCLHCTPERPGLHTRAFPEVFVEGTTEPRIPRERWGKSHERVLLYIETVCVDHGGRPDPRRMTQNPARTPPMGNPGGWDDKYSSMLKDGTKVLGHDDWCCVEDLIAAGLLHCDGTGGQPVYVLTDLGWDVAGHLRRQRAENGRK